MAVYRPAIIIGSSEKKFVCVHNTTESITRKLTSWVLER